MRVNKGVECSKSLDRMKSSRTIQENKVKLSAGSNRTRKPINPELSYFPVRSDADISIEQVQSASSSLH